MLRRNAPSIVSNYTRTGTINPARPAPAVVLAGCLPASEGDQHRSMPL